jgi:hypothetical protein
MLDIWMPEPFEWWTKWKVVFGCPVPNIQSSEYRTGFQMVTSFWLPSCNKHLNIRTFFHMVSILTAIYPSLDRFVRYTNVPVIKCPVSAKMDHLNTRLVRCSDLHFIWFLLSLIFQLQDIKMRSEKWRLWKAINWITVDIRNPDRSGFWMVVLDRSRPFDCRNIRNSDVVSES